MMTDEQPFLLLALLLHQHSTSLALDLLLLWLVALLGSIGVFNYWGWHTWDNIVLNWSLFLVAPVVLLAAFVWTILLLLRIAPTW